MLTGANDASSNSRLEIYLPPVIRKHSTFDAETSCKTEISTKTTYCDIT